MSSSDPISNPDSVKRPSPALDQPPLKRLKEDEGVPKNQGPEIRKSCPTLKRSESHGITEYVSKAHNGFFGILKHRISDFIVNEIDSEEKVVKLTDMSLEVKAAKGEDDNNNRAQARDKLKAAVGEDKFEKIEAMIEENLAAESNKEEEEGKSNKEEEEGKEASKPTPTREVIIPAPDGRDARTGLHGLLRDAFPSLESQTDDGLSEDGNSFVRIIRVKFLVDCLMAKAKGKSRGFLHPGGKRADKWPRDRPDFCHFVLYKENTDTMDAINVVSGNLGLKTGNFVFSGTKDKRGMTTQRVSVQKVNGQRLLALNKSLKCIKVGNIEYKKTSLKMGDNWGNQFRLVLRNMKAEEKDTVKVAMHSLAETGFINYYGMQRFGSTEISTHSIGLALLKRDWREAIDLILRPRPNDRTDMEECRAVWVETKDPAKALEKLGRRKCPERCLLSGLSKHASKNDYCGALNWIPRTARLMYVHAYQSMIWNNTVSKKFAKHGLEARVGDLVAKHPGADKVATKDVVVLTEENVGDFGIYDVVMPLVGHDVIFPENETKAWMWELFTQDGLTIESFNSSVRDYALPGGYRHVLIKPKDLEWNLLDYEDENEPLNSIDDDEVIESSFLRKKKTEDVESCSDNADKLDASAAAASADAAASDSSNSLKTPQRLAVVMTFALPSSCYATMAIREVLRMDVSSGFQATLML